MTVAPQRRIVAASHDHDPPALRWRPSLVAVSRVPAALPRARRGLAGGSSRLSRMPPRTLSRPTIRRVIVGDASSRWSTTSAAVSSTSAESRNSTRCWLPGAAVCGEADGSSDARSRAETIQGSVRRASGHLQDGGSDGVDVVVVTPLRSAPAASMP